MNSKTAVIKENEMYRESVRPHGTCRKGYVFRVKKRVMP